ncbi:hypothetical protein [Pedosphaera parvula]|uniref:Uncharacterized protein n=1 Tax=Pedosphaera parvula (strain Ellin514) TaxID=320771 RepID=B9XNZ4_PEDPL|nr:hypothetical protein [Pedosphaera parvula]EEF58460.1 hypothetical protein Cflav_PD1083 [Pedosphaera parvula Ellin514]
MKVNQNSRLRYKVASRITFLALLLTIGSEGWLLWSVTRAPVHAVQSLQSPLEFSSIPVQY